ncbi:MAG: hypothetical protein NPIRA05_02260 [Nitrospirales bacterium]|nr:MAG: hypothetical protein NPIRA05_02260 [Nitrospirales bacterium]
MYLAYYGLKKEAFQTTPDPSFLYMSSSHKEAFGAIVYGIEKRKGFVEITGEVGVGKTTIIRAFLEEHGDSKEKTVYIFNPVLTYHALLTAIFKALNLVPLHDDETEMVNQLHEALIQEYKTGGTVILIIDEAQNMPVETLENLRMLSNLETATEKLIQVILVGQPELETLLNKPELRQFQQRIALRAKICPLTEKESQAFILHRIAVASTPRNPVFTSKALQLLARKGRGIPRRLNVLCDNALITGFGRQLTPVPVSVVKEILSDIDGSHSPVPWKWALVAGFVLLLGIGMIVFWESLNFYMNNGVVHNMNGGELGSLRTTKDSTALHQQEVEQVKASIPDGFRIDASRPQALLATGQGEDATVGPETTGVIETVKKELVVSTQSPSEQLISSSSMSGREADASFSRPLSATQVVEAVEGENGLLKNFKAPSATVSIISDGGHRSLQSKKFPSTATQQKQGGAAVHHSTMRRAVKVGESLSQIAQEAYGSTKKKYIEWVRRHNPNIVNPDMILPGQYIVLPEYDNTVVSK